MPKQIVVVFDTSWAEDSPGHQKIIGEIMGDRVDIRVFSFFTLTSLQGGEVGEGISPDDIGRIDPAIIIVELDIMAILRPTGVMLVENLRRASRLSLTPIFVTTDIPCRLVTRRQLRKLGVEEVFPWTDLDRETA